MMRTCAAALLIFLSMTGISLAQSQAPACFIVQTTIDGQTKRPCLNSVVPAQSTAAANALIVSSTPVGAMGVYATNLTATAGFLVVLDAGLIPADGAITPVDCVPLPANGNASINYASGPAKNYAVGMIAIITSASTCFTKTTGVITGFISGMAIGP